MAAEEVNEIDEPDLKGSNAQAILTYRLTKYASFHAGYRRRLGQYDFTTLVPDAVIEDYDLGVDASGHTGL